MVEESSPLLPPAEESIEAETNTAVEPEPESGEPTQEGTIQHGFVCGCEVSMRTACEGLPSYKDQPYCVLHSSLNDKSADFKAALDSKLSNSDFDFRGVRFPDKVDFAGFVFTADADFESATFSADADFRSAVFPADANFVDAAFGANAYFSYAKFGADALFYRATFGADAYFISAIFSADAGFFSATFKAGATFSSATFNPDAGFSFATFTADADFTSATFLANSDFSDATFSSIAYFSAATFNADASFRSATFSTEADFGSATDRLLKSGARVAPMPLGDDPSLDFQHVRSEHPERISFGKLKLRPHWFINVDARKFDFTEVEWVGLLERHYTVADEIDRAKEMVPSPHKLLSIACWQLASNAEENHRFREASHLRYWSMDTQRLEMSMKDAFYWLHWIYWGLSGYGERILRAFIGLIVILVLFTFFYTQVGFSQQPPATANEPAASTVSEDRVGKPLELPRAFTYSLGVMSLQKPDPRPVTSAAQTLIILETILGPVQAALLALAIRRRFMVSG